LGGGHKRKKENAYREEKKDRKGGHYGTGRTARHVSKKPDLQKAAEDLTLPEEEKKKGKKKSHGGRRGEPIRKTKQLLWVVGGHNALRNFVHRKGKVTGNESTRQ